jgi:hypothetical protein
LSVTLASSMGPVSTGICPFGLSQDTLFYKNACLSASAAGAAI